MDGTHDIDEAFLQKKMEQCECSQMPSSVQCAEQCAVCWAAVCGVRCAVCWAAVCSVLSCGVQRVGQCAVC